MDHKTNSGITPLTPEQVAKQEAQAGKAGFIHRNLIALDMELNTLTDGNNDETISSRLARDAEKGHELGIIGSKLLDIVQHNHGAKAIAGDLQRANAIKAIEEADPVIEK